MESNNYVELARKFRLVIDTHKNITDDEEDYTEIVTCEKYWSTILQFVEESALIREFYSSITLAEREEHLQFGISCFLCFVQANFTGPELPKTIQDFLNNDKYAGVSWARKLSMNNEEINCNTRYSVLLVISEAIFDSCIVDNLVNLWWCCRALIVHQEIVDEPSPTLLSNADLLLKIMVVNRSNSSVDVNIQALLDIELAQLYLKFRHASKAKEYLQTASEALGLEYHQVGKLGRRTKHQQTELAQLALNITLSDKDDVERPEIEEICIPTNVGLNDDVRLDQVEFVDGSENIKLSNTEQKLLIGVVLQTLLYKPADELQNEELIPFLETVLNQRNTYTVRVMALLLRSKLENTNRRTAERSMKQMEEIVAAFSKPEPHPLNRLGDVFGTALPPIWKVETQYAQYMLNIGLVKSSLDVFLKVKLWEELIVCYTLLNLRHKATEVIKQQLQIKPTVKMMCLLGDATDDENCYKEAWEMSKKRSHRAQRHWGNFLFQRKQYAECIPHYQRSLSINPLQPQIWLRLGYAGLQEEKWQIAATAYRRYTSLEPDGFEAWNNLAQAYIKLDNKINAHQALLEALKCNFDNWKVWENFLMVSCDTANYYDVIRAYHRLIDLKDKYLNVDVLSVVVTSILDENIDLESDNLLLKKTLELLGRVTGIYPNNGTLWELYSSLTTDVLTRAQRLQRAYRCFTQTGWDKDPKSCCQVLAICNQLLKAVLSEKIHPNNPILNSVRLSLRSTISALNKQNWGEINTILKEVSDSVEKLSDRVKTAANSMQSKESTTTTD